MAKNHGTDYMGLQLTDQFEKKNLPEYAIKPPKDISGPKPSSRFLAMEQRMPDLSQAAAISGWIDEENEQATKEQGETRELTVYKSDNGSIGLRIRHVKNGLYVALVHQDSPAAQACLRFGDQIIKINGEEVAGWDTAKAVQVLKQVTGEVISFTVKNRPYEKTFNIFKDDRGSTGLVFKNGKIKSLVKNSSAATSGVLMNHQIIEVNNQSVVGEKDAQLQKMLDTADFSLTITTMPSIIYDHIVKCLGDSINKTSTNRSIPDL